MSCPAGTYGALSLPSPPPSVSASVESADETHYLAATTTSSKTPKRYTFLLKDEVLPLRTDGREQSTISYEYEFQAEPSTSTDPRTASTTDATTTITIPFSKFRATYRGKDTPDARAINLKEVRRMSLMMRRYVLLPLYSLHVFRAPSLPVPCFISPRCGAIRRALLRSSPQYSTAKEKLTLTRFTATSAPSKAPSR